MYAFLPMLGCLYTFGGDTEELSISLQGDQKKLPKRAEPITFIEAWLMEGGIWKTY
jgi:hypothetical protein